jgi:hypothetical protein
MRVIAKGVPANRTTGGKNSSIDGPWKVPWSVGAMWAFRFAA